MPRYVAALIWWTVMGMGTVTALWGLFADLVLIHRGLPSITEYLRGAPWAFWGPLVVLGAAILILTVHLFIRAANGH